MSDLYSEFLVKKEPTSKDAITKYGLIGLTVLAAVAGLLFNFLFLLAAVVLGIACYFIVPKTDLEYEYLFVNGEMDIDMVMAKSKRKKAKTVRSWCGWLDEAFDGVPFLSPVEEAPGLILACGFTGHGFGTAPAVGLMLSQMVRGEKTVVDISALRYDRFKPCR